MLWSEDNDYNNSDNNFQTFLSLVYNMVLNESFKMKYLFCSDSPLLNEGTIVGTVANSSAQSNFIHFF